MASTLISGPAGAGKCAVARQLREDWLAEGGEPVALADFQSLYAAVAGDQRGPDGRFPLRDERLLPVVEYLRRALLTAARERGLRIIATNSDGDPERREFLLRELGEGAQERVVDPGEDVVRARLSDPTTGTLSEECTAAANRWYRRK